MIIVTPIFSQAEYVKNYDDALALLTIQEPNAAIDKLQKILLNAEITADKDSQLLALYYLAESYSILSNQEQTEYIVKKDYYWQENKTTYLIYLNSWDFKPFY